MIGCWRLSVILCEPGFTNRFTWIVRTMEISYNLVVFGAKLLFVEGKKLKPFFKIKADILLENPALNIHELSTLKLRFLT